MKRTIRSYHKAFMGEMVLHRLGKDWVLWWALPARQICWTVGIELFVVLALSVLGVHLPMFGIPWAAAYVALPIGLGWMCTVSYVEGRRLHLAIGAWLAYAFRGRDTIGGYRRVSSPAALRMKRIHFLPVEQRRRRLFRKR